MVTVGVDVKLEVGVGVKVTGNIWNTCRKNITSQVSDETPVSFQDKGLRGIPYWMSLAVAP